MKKIIEYVKNEGLKFENNTNEYGEETLQGFVGDESITITNAKEWFIISARGYSDFKYEEEDVIAYLENLVQFNL